MTDAYPRPSGSSITPILAGAALVLAGYLVLDRTGVFNPSRGHEPRTATPRGDLANFEKTTIRIFEDNSPSAVHITTNQEVVNQIGRSGTRQGTGSGIIWDTAGHILTNHHVVDNARSGAGGTEIRVHLNNRKTYRAHFIFSYEYLDLAIIKLDDPPRGLRPPVIGTSGDLKVGQAVFAIGNPFGLEQTLTTGIISALDRTISTGNDVTLSELIQVDAAINPGNSGGLLLDSAGRLIGMNTAIYSQTGESAGIGFAVPIDKILPMVPRLLEKKPPISAGFGIEAIAMMHTRLGPDLDYGYGVDIAVVNPEGAAAQAGLRALKRRPDRVILGGDMIVRVEGERVESVNKLYRILETHTAGETLNVEVARFRDSTSYQVVPARVTLRTLETEGPDKD